ncbi:MAG: hypothetical protein ACYS21_13815 [Planctomycetota bacterium]|jgi:hypothetical protein
MTSLTNQQKQLLFDYCTGVSSEKEAAEAEQLVASKREAADLHSRFKAALAPLDALQPEPCPIELVEGAIWRLNNVARSTQLRLEKLLADEQARGVTARSPLWWNFGKVVAAAAVVFLVLGTWFAPLDFIRHKYRKLQCQRQFAGIFHGFSNYVSDHDGKMPAVPTAAGAPWWKVGYKGPENHSATRNMWLLVKNNYVEPVYFVCPGRGQKLVIKISPAKIRSYDDFPDREHVSYSVRIRCDKAKRQPVSVPRVFISDLSPLFENLPQNYAEPLRLKLNDELLTRNSSAARMSFSATAVSCS